MTICNILSTLPVGDDTAVVAEGERALFRQGTGILDENGKPFEVKSVGLDGIKEEDPGDKFTLLIAGSFSSEKLFV